MFVIDSETFAEISPIEYNRKFISQKTRSDGRGLLDFRTARVQINAISTANGSSQVRTGKTLVVCGIKAQIASPTVEAPKNGYIVVNVDLPPNCSSKFKPGPPSEMSQTMTDYVNRIISSSGMIDTSQLCIEENTVVWVLHIDVICIKYDGNVFDAVMLAVMTALKSTKLPLVTFNEEDKSVVAAIENTVSIELVKSALSVSFSVFDGIHILADPTDKEEVVQTGQISVVFDDNQGILGILKLGSGGSVTNTTAMSKYDVERCIKLALPRHNELLGLMKMI